MYIGFSFYLTNSFQQIFKQMDTLIVMDRSTVDTVQLLSTWILKPKNIIQRHYYNHIDFNPAHHQLIATY